MNTTSNDEGAEDKDGQIRHHAYMLWLAEGQPDGLAEEHWRLATEAITPDPDKSPTVPSGGNGRTAGSSPSDP